MQLPSRRVVDQLCIPLLSTTMKIGGKLPMALLASERIHQDLTYLETKPWGQAMVQEETMSSCKVETVRCLRLEGTSPRRWDGTSKEPFLALSIWCSNLETSRYRMTLERHRIFIYLSKRGSSSSMRERSNREKCHHWLLSRLRRTEMIDQVRWAQWGLLLRAWIRNQGNLVPLCRPEECSTFHPS